MEENVNDSDDNTASCSEDRTSYSASNSNIERNNINHSNRTAQINFNNFNLSENCLSQNNFLDKKDLKKRIGPTGRSGHQAVTAAIPIKMFTVDF